MDLISIFHINSYFLSGFGSSSKRGGVESKRKKTFYILNSNVSPLIDKNYEYDEMLINKDDDVRRRYLFLAALAALYLTLVSE